MRSLEPRITALEASRGNMREPLLILRRIVSPGSLDACPMGTLPAPPHLPAVDTVVQVTSRDVPELESDHAEDAQATDHGQRVA